jgi:universal stress protein E
MKRFKNILYFADGVIDACPALSRAVSLARTNRARLTVMDVVGETPPAAAEIRQRFGLDVDQLLLDQREDSLDKLIHPFQEPGTLIYTQVVSGVPFVEVIRAVLRSGFDLVVKPARPPGGLSERLLGSTDLHILRKCPCPVWIDRPGKTVPYANVLVAVDPMRDEEEGCARMLMDLATSLVERESAQLDVLHAWRLEGESILRGGRARLPKEEVDRLVEEEERNHEERFRALLAGYGRGIEHPHVHLVKGEPGASIREWAERLHADVIVMGTLGRSGIPGFIIGNTAEEVLHTTETSILAVKPAGFVSPVTP